MHVENVKADVLCVGGGIACLMAAIRAGELGLDVVVADKANTLYSGSGGLGNDHFLCYIPEIHGKDIKPIIRAVQGSVSGGMRHADLLQTWLESTFDMVKLWDSWGISMKYEGNYEFAGHVIPGKPKIFMHYNGRDQKKVLTREALKRNVRIINRVMVFDLLAAGGHILGAIGVDTRAEKILVFEAKSVILGTGRCVRLYRPPVPGAMFNVAHSPGGTGDGMGMSYRAGAGLANLEITPRWAGPRYLARCGKASWVGVLRDPSGNPVGPFVTKPDKEFGDPISDIHPPLFNDYARDAKGPVYMDCRGISDEDYQYMVHFMKHEGLGTLLDHLEEEGADLRKNPVEFGTYQMMPGGGIFHDEKGETTVKGLFTIGDEAYSTGGISFSATTGWMSGGHAARYAENRDMPEPADLQPLIEVKKKMLTALGTRKDGPDWKEVNTALQQIMFDYAGEKRTTHLLEAGLRYLRRIRQKAHETMIAGNPHELMHCLEVLNLIDVGEALFIAANERKETRGPHKRPDYPFTNPTLEKFLVVRKEGDQPVTEWHDLRN
ncbi:MAG: FAD-binding protein [Pseudomonadota bacterium]